MAAKVLLTGGTGQTGTALAARLRKADIPVQIASRRGENAEQVRFDWDDPATYDAALEGVDRVYLVAPALAMEPEQVMVPFLRRALELGVRRAVLLSSSAIPEGGPVLGKVHRAVREMMPEWGILQPSWFLQNFLGPMHIQNIREHGEIVTATGEGKVPFVDVEDIAAVAYASLVDATPHNQAHIITGAQALSYGDMAAVIAEAAQRPVRHISITGEELCQRFVAAGMTPDYAMMLANLDLLIREGREDRVTDTVLRITGHPPRSTADFVQANATRWQQ